MANLLTIVSLWHGDTETAGYQHAELVIAACDVRQPRTLTELETIFYPVREDADAEALAIIEQGFDLWQARKALPQPKRGGVVGRVSRFTT